MQPSTTCERTDSRNCTQRAVEHPRTDPRRAAGLARLKEGKLLARTTCPVAALVVALSIETTATAQLRRRWLLATAFVERA